MTYTVKKGDTLSGIARAHNTTVEALVASNGIKNAIMIFVGQVLKIPTKAPSTEAVKIINECVADIQKLPSFNKVMELIDNG